MTSTLLENYTTQLASLNAILAKVPSDETLLKKIGNLQLMVTLLTQRETEKTTAAANLATNNTEQAAAKTELVNTLGDAVSGLVYSSIICGDGSPCLEGTSCLKCRIAGYQTAGLSAEEIRTLLLL